MILILIAAIAATIFFWVRIEMAWGKSKGQTFTHCAEIQGDGTYDFDIVGESNYQDTLNEICGGKKPKGHKKEVVALLFQENNNPHDSQAVCVRINERTVGYLSRDDARAIRAKFARTDLYWKANAIIVGGWDNGDGSEGLYGVKLDF